MESGIINYFVYEDGSDYMGIAKVTLPTLVYKMLTVNGAGLAGDVDLPVIGHRDAMKCSIEFVDASTSAYKLNEARKHLIDCRVAHEQYDTTAGQLGVIPHKVIMELVPTQLNNGVLAPATPQGVSGEYSVLSFKLYIDGKCVLDFDPLRWRDIDASGKDNLAAVRSALGK